jgi:predicted nucleic acid-binding protein
LFFDVGYLITVEFENMLDKLIEKKLLILPQIDSRLQGEAWNIFLKFNLDKKWSYTDRTSKAIMNEMEIYEAFTFDHHFQQM